MRNRGRVISPMFMLVVALIIFEFTIRLPYAYWVGTSGVKNAFERYRFFSSIPYQEVLYVGIGLLAVLSIFLAVLGISGRASYPAIKIERGLPPIGKSIYLWGLIFIIIVGSTIVLLGVDTVAEDISSKRQEVGYDGVLWFFLKMSMFSHVLVSLFYIRYMQTGKFVDLVMCILSFALVAIPAIVFSQRALIIAQVVEIIYIQMFFGTFNMRKMVKISLLVSPVLLSISILRAGLHEDGSLTTVLFNGLEKIVQTRYFLDIAKLGTVSIWYLDEPWLGPVSIGFIFEFFNPDNIIFYKEIGPMIAYDVYKEYTNGVTPGGLLEAIISFGYIGGLLFFIIALLVFFHLERRMLLATRWGALRFFIVMFALAKFPIFVNSSLGAFAFQVILESVFLFFLLFGLGLVGGGKRRRVRRVDDRPRLKRMTTQLSR